MISESPHEETDRTSLAPASFTTRPQRRPRTEGRQLAMWPDVPAASTPPTTDGSPSRRVRPTRAAAHETRGERLIWDGMRQAFHPDVLREAMLVRGFTAETLQLAAGIGRGTMYNILEGRGTRLRTARIVLETLAAVKPTLDLAELV